MGLVIIVETSIVSQWERSLKRSSWAITPYLTSYKHSTFRYVDLQYFQVSRNVERVLDLRFSLNWNGLLLLCSGNSWVLYFWLLCSSQCNVSYSSLHFLYEILLYLQLIVLNRSVGLTKTGLLNNMNFLPFWWTFACIYWCDCHRKQIWYPLGKALSAAFNLRPLINLLKVN